MDMVNWRMLHSLMKETFSRGRFLEKEKYNTKMAMYSKVILKMQKRQKVHCTMQMETGIWGHF